MITVARLESELDYWFSAAAPVCSVLWLIGGSDDLVPALTRAAGDLGQLECRAAACARWGRPPLFPAAGCEQLLRAELELTGSAIEGARGPILRHPSSRGSVCEVVSADPARGDGIWQTLATATGLSVCAGLFPSGGAVPEQWPFSAMRLVMVAGTTALSGGTALGGQDALLHAFLADTLQGGGIAAIKGSLELCGPGVALTGSTAAIDEVERVFAAAARAEDVQVRHSAGLAGPWSAPGYRAYKYSPDGARWIPASR